VTRAALRILERARSSAWRRVGIPESWDSNTAPTTVPEVPATTLDETTGQNVAGAPAEDAGTGRPLRPAESTTEVTAGS
jgi:hypothetical protein